MLSLVSTPIGNLKDITLRALETLKSADYILCEDTRHSLKLLSHFGIEKSLYSLHSHNESHKSERIIEDLKSGKQIALICDAGTPGICDPSAILVRKCHEEGIKVEAAVGASSLTAALSLYGLMHPHFQFLGFAPKEPKDLTLMIEEALDFSGTSVFFDTPHQIKRTLTYLDKKKPNLPICIIRELSKIHETRLIHLPKEWLEITEQSPLKGEMICILEGKKEAKEEISEEHVIKTLKEELDLSYNDLIRVAAKLLNKPKNALYKKWL